MPCKVSYIPSRLGKSPYAQKNVIYTEYSELMPHMSNYLPDLLQKNADFVNYIKTPGILD
jgi:hypothetical protein